MSTIDDLRTSLDEHAASVQDHALVSRAAEVHRRVRVVRRRRQAGAVAAAAVVVVGAVGVAAALPRGEQTNTPVDLPAPTGTPSPATPAPAGAPEFPQQLGDGAPLAGEFVGAAGQADLRFHVRATRGTLRWSTYCAPRHAGWYTVTFNGVERMMGQCNSSPGDPGTWWSSFDDLTRADGAPLRPGDRIDVRVRLFENRHTHTLVSDPRVRLGVGAYDAPAG
jgi:hypothetical protein